MEYNFEWDPNNASTNFQKYHVSFAWATSGFKDPLAVSIIDKEHSEAEQLWITLGQADNGQCAVVVHMSCIAHGKYHHEIHGSCR